MKVKDYNNGYAVIKMKSWEKEKDESNVEDWFNNLDEAVKQSNKLEKLNNYKILFVVVSCEKVNKNDIQNNSE